MQSFAQINFVVTYRNWTNIVIFETKWWLPCLFFYREFEFQ